VSGREHCRNAQAQGERGDFRRVYLVEARHREAVGEDGQAVLPHEHLELREAPPADVPADL